MQHQKYIFHQEDGDIIVVFSAEFEKLTLFVHDYIMFFRQFMVLIVLKYKIK